MITLGKYTTMNGRPATVKGTCNETGYWGYIHLGNGDSYAAIWTDDGKCIERPELSLSTEDFELTQNHLIEFFQEVHTRLDNIENILKEANKRNSGGL